MTTSLSVSVRPLESIKPLSIRLEQCAKNFGSGASALQPIDLEIHPGETLVLLGPSGCGKTTTLRLIAGLAFPDAGVRILFGDEDVTDLQIEKRGVVMVFQNYALFPNMTVGENIAYGLKIRKIAPAERLAGDGALARSQSSSHRSVVGGGGETARCTGTRAGGGTESIAAG